MNIGGVGEFVLIAAVAIIPAALMALPPALVVWYIRRSKLLRKEREGIRFSLPLHRAVQEGRVEAVQQLLTEGCPIDQRDAHGWTPLHVAMLHRQFETAQFLLFNHARTDVTNTDGHTPLYYAAQNRDEGLVQLLVQYGADPNRL